MSFLTANDEAVARIILGATWIDGSLHGQRETWAHLDRYLVADRHARLLSDADALQLWTIALFDAARAGLDGDPVRPTV